ncbi:radical SAM protein, partial [Desulfovibrio sp. OttesenSCG-928-M14]|nr:radical SAM protein [Desulfovibrio sp. OttesenSCG-928-M14]
LAARLSECTDLESVDLARTYAYEDMAISFTNRCNLRCVYCIQSTQAAHNPYFTLDFPAQYAAKTLDFFVSTGIRRVRTCVEGEATLYSRWYEVFSSFKDAHPDIALYMTTNLARRYTDSEIDLLARYQALDVSCDTLDPVLFAKLRRGGKLALLLDNINMVQARAKELGITGPLISLHAVVSDLTWPGIEKLVDYAFAHNMLPVLGNYEERANSLAFQKQICKPLTTMPREEQAAAHKLFRRVHDELMRRGHKHIIGEYLQGGLFHDIAQNVKQKYNLFDPYDDNPLHNAFLCDPSQG